MIETIKERKKRLNREAVRRYKAKNKELLYSKRRAQDATPEGKAKSRAKNAAYSRDHKAKKRASEKAWLMKNPTWTKEKNARARARRANAVGSHTQYEWEVLCRQVDGLCLYCLLEKNVENRPDKLTRDHVLPLSRGGSDFIENIVPACRSCNSRKKDRSIEDYFGSLATAIMNRGFDAGGL